MTPLLAGGQLVRPVGPVRPAPLMDAGKPACAAGGCFGFAPSGIAAAQFYAVEGID